MVLWDVGRWTLTPRPLNDPWIAQQSESLPRRGCFSALWLNRLHHPAGVGFACWCDATNKERSYIHKYHTVRTKCTYIISIFAYGGGCSQKICNQILLNLALPLYCNMRPSHCFWCLPNACMLSSISLSSGTTCLCCKPSGILIAGTTSITGWCQKWFSGNTPKKHRQVYSILPETRLACILQLKCSCILAPLPLATLTSTALEREREKQIK